MTPDPQPQTALMLTQQEWDDLVGMVDHYRFVTGWVEWDEDHQESPDHVAMVHRQRALAERIIEANR